MSASSTYVRPGFVLSKLVNPIVGRLGLGSALVVRGRRTGRRLVVPMGAPIRIGGARYLVSGRGETQWVRNLRRTQRAEFRFGRRTEPFRPVEITGAERTAIVTAYRRRLGRSVDRYFRAIPDPADHAVFRMEATLAGIDSAPGAASSPRDDSAGDRAAPERVWRALAKASFAVVAHVDRTGRPRSSGVVYGLAGHRLCLVVAPDSRKAREIADGSEVAVTVPIRRGGLLALVAPIPPATVSFRARAIVHPGGSVDVATMSPRLASLLPAGRRDGVLLELVPEGPFLTYGVGVPLRDMTDPAMALRRVPLGGAAAR